MAPMAMQAKTAAYMLQPEEPDELQSLSSCIFDDAVMKERLDRAVYLRFKEAIRSGAPTGEDDQRSIAAALFKWAREQGAVAFAHWFFPVRGGAGANGGMCGAARMETLIDTDWASPEQTKPFNATLPYERLFAGQNGGLRMRPGHKAAFTTWDRSSPCFVLDRVLRIPCTLVTKCSVRSVCIDEKTPLLRSIDAVNRQGLRLLRNLGIAAESKAVISYLGWEQEFYVTSTALWKKRPDLVNCGRTLLGRPPPRNEQSELNYFAPLSTQVEKLMFNVQATMLKLGVPMACLHAEFGAGQLEMCPIFCHAAFSCDNNVLFMEVLEREAEKLSLRPLLHEKPFQGASGSGKHNNWSLGTDTGVNFFHPGKTSGSCKLFVSAVACVAHGLAQHNEVVRACVAHAGNDIRMGENDAPPAVITMYPSMELEAHIDRIIGGGALVGFHADRSTVDPGCSATMVTPAGVEDRNRHAPFTFCGNRFEFRAVGSSQSCHFPICVCNAVMASGMAALSDLIEGGMSHRDAVAKLFQDNRHVIYTGDPYADGFAEEAARLGLPNFKDTPSALAALASDKAKALFTETGVMSAEECEARAEIMLENYIVTLSVEVATFIKMVETGILPACAMDMAKYAAMPSLAGDRQATYEAIRKGCDRLKEVFGKESHVTDEHWGEFPALMQEARRLCDVVKPEMVAVRELVDAAEDLIEARLFPYPTCEELIYQHQY